MYDISVILPRVSDEKKLAAFLSGVLSPQANAEVIICSEVDTENLSRLGEEELSRVKIVRSADALKNAITAAEGRYIIFSDVGVTYSADALSALSERGACAFNGSSKNGSLLSEDFCLDEVGRDGLYFCCMMNADVLKNNGILPVSDSSFSIMNLIADYARYDEIETVHETMFYIENVPEATADADDIENLENYAWLFSQTAGDKVTLLFIRNVMSVFSSCEHRQTFELLKNVLLPFMGDYAVCAWFKAAYGWDPELLKSDISPEDFKRLGTGVWYREVRAPIRESDIVDGFFYGKLSISVLKRSIYAYIYYKAKRMGSAFLKDKICGFCKRKLGGGYNV